MRCRLPLIGLLVLFGLGVPASRADEARPPTYDAWIERLDAAVSTRDAARRRLEKAEEAVRVMRHRRYPRGEAREEIEQERAEAERALERAETTLPALLEEARHEGIPAGVLRPYEALQGAGGDARPAASR